MSIKQYFCFFLLNQITAHEAKDLGLVTEVFPDASFQQEVWPKIQAYAKLPLKSLVYSKALSRDFEKDILHKASLSALMT